MDMTDMKKLKTVFWHDNVLYAKDQVLLPYEEKVARLGTVQEVCDAIYALAIRGAPAIGVSGAYAMVLAVREAPSRELEAVVNYLKEVAPKIAAVRPTATNLSWAVNLQLKLVNEGASSTEELEEKLLQRAHAISEMEIETSDKVSQLGADLVPEEGASIITHCNTGPLCTIDIGMCIGATIYAHNQGKKIRVFTDETRPRLQGAKLNVYELRQYGVPYTLLTDNMAAYAMQQGMIDMAFVGADRVVANGDMAAKIGVYGLAVLAQAHGIPFYGFCPMSTFDDSIACGEDIEIEQRPAQEVLNINGKQLAPEDTPVLNPAFDVTPHRYFAGIITEEGIAYPPYNKSLRELKKKYDARMKERGF